MEELRRQCCADQCGEDKAMMSKQRSAENGCNVERLCDGCRQVVSVQQVVKQEENVSVRLTVMGGLWLGKSSGDRLR